MTNPAPSQPAQRGKSAAECLHYGYAACNNGLPLNANPHPQRTERGWHDSWRSGWLLARADADNVKSTVQVKLARSHDEIARLYYANKSFTQIADRFNVSAASVSKYLVESGLNEAACERDKTAMRRVLNGTYDQVQQMVREGMNATAIYRKIKPPCHIVTFRRYVRAMKKEVVRGRAE